MKTIEKIIEKLEGICAIAFLSIAVIALGILIGYAWSYIIA